MMDKSKKDSFKTGQRPSWRDYQKTLKRPAIANKSRRWVLILTIISAALYSLYIGLAALATPADAVPTPAANGTANKDDLIAKKDVRLLLEHLNIDQLLAKQIELPMKAQQLHVETSLDPDLQTYLTGQMDRKNSRFIGIVVMEADTGRMLALAGFDKTDAQGNPCLQSSFPAASIFKIVTAAAAVDHCGYNADTVMRFNGYKHTLYKNQLKKQINRHTNAVSFKDSFAQSVNPVFGKLGILNLGKPVLEQYATAFGFNRPIDFELPIAPSHLHINEKPYHWAEIASGFNHDTTISPVHAAMMASAVLNKGRMVAPTIVDRISDNDGRLLYRTQTAWGGQAMTTNASSVLKRLMMTTVRSGTGRKAFRDQRRHKVLSKLHIGGKTGSIFNRSHDARFDWFVGFAREKKGSDQLIVAALVAHEEYIGTRAAEYARKAMTHYFKSHLARHENKKLSPNT